MKARPSGPSAARRSDVSDHRHVAEWCESLHFLPAFYQDQGESTIITPHGPAVVVKRVSTELIGAMTIACLAAHEALAENRCGG